MQIYLLIFIIISTLHCCFFFAQAFNIHLLALHGSSSPVLQLITYTDGAPSSVTNLTAISSAYIKVQATFNAAKHCFYVFGLSKFNDSLDFLVIDAQSGLIQSKTTIPTDGLLLSTLFHVYYDVLAMKVVDLHYELTDLKPWLLVIDPTRNILIQNITLNSFQTVPELFATDLRTTENTFGYCLNQTQYCVTNISFLTNGNNTICGNESRWPAYSIDLVGPYTFLVVTGGDMPMIMKVTLVGTNLQTHHLKMFDDGIPIKNLRSFDTSYQLDTNGVVLPVHASVWKSSTNSSLVVRIVSFDQALEKSNGESFEITLSETAIGPDFVPLALGFSGQMSPQNPISPPGSPNPFHNVPTWKLILFIGAGLIVASIIIASVSAFVCKKRQSYDVIV